jgi:hypothetical protein
MAHPLHTYIQVSGKETTFAVKLRVGEGATALGWLCDINTELSKWAYKLCFVFKSICFCFQKD